MILKKDLNLLSVFSITAGAIMSSGLFILPGLAHTKTGPSILISYLLAGLLATTGMLSQAELASAMPKAGGTYFYVMRSMGPAVGTIYGFITLLALALKSSFELIGMAAFTRFIIDMDIRPIAMTFCLGFIFLNLLGVKEAGRVQVFLVFGILTALTAYVVKGIPVVNLHHFIPFAPGGFDAIFSTAGFVFVSYGGLLKVASLAEEVKNPGKILPLGMIVSLIVVAIVYTSVIFVTIGLLDPLKLDGTLTPVTDGAETIMGPWGKLFLSIAAILAFTSATNAGIMGASRYPLALSRDNLLPKFFSQINDRFKTPSNAILITGLIMMAALFLKLNIIVEVASSVLILTYLFSCLAMIILRESRLQNYQPRFHAPLYPWIQIVGVIGFTFLLFEMGREALFISLLLIIAGFFVYWFYGKIRAQREFALLHLIERITAKELTTRHLETELKEIIRERDEIIKDSFDNIVEKSDVLDIIESLSIENFFQQAAEALCKNINMERRELYDLLLERERDTSTVITPGIAIPHIIIPGEHAFEILLARCRNGVIFSQSAKEVHAIFVLAGTKDERNFHLRALAAIAQIIQDPQFEKKWLKAKNKEALRDVVLLGQRKR